MISFVKIFISSTFKDLVEERKSIRTFIIPALQSYADEYGLTIIPIDLSWGITDSESHSKKVLERCLLEIDNSRPFFIGIIGERYGWIPKEADLSINTFSLFPDVRKWLDLNKSITEMEMLYGALESEKNVDAAFYISNVITNSIPLTELITRIVNDGKFPTHKFSSIDEFCNLVISDFKTFLEKYYSESETASRRVTRQHELPNYVSISERAKYIEAYMNLHGKHCTDNQLKRLSICPLSNHVDCLSMILQLLILYAAYETIDSWIKKIEQFETKSNLYEAIIELFIEEFGYNAIKKALGFIISLKTPVSCFELSDMSGSSEYLIRALSMVIKTIIEKDPNSFYCYDEYFRNTVKGYFSINKEYEYLAADYHIFKKYVNLTYNGFRGDYEGAIFDLENMAGYYQEVENYPQAIWYLNEALMLRSEYGKMYGFEKLVGIETKPISFSEEDLALCLIACAELYMKTGSKKDVKRTIDWIEEYKNSLQKKDLDRISDIIVWLRANNAGD